MVGELCGGGGEEEACEETCGNRSGGELGRGGEAG